MACLSELPPSSAIMPMSSKIRSQVTGFNSRISVQEAVSLTSSGRSVGVFPDGVQPYRLIIVVDDALTSIDVGMLKSNNFTVITGSNLDANGFLTLIRNNPLFQRDNTLFIVQPGLDFFLKNLEVLFYVDDAEEIPSETITSKKSVATHLSSLLSLVKDVSYSLREADLKILTNLCKNEFLPLDFDCGGLSMSNSEGSAMVAVKPVLQSSATEVFVKRLLHGSLALRAALVANSNNNELIMLGFPVKSLLLNKDLTKYTDKVRLHFPSI